MENKRRKIEETLQDSVIWDNSLIKEIKDEDICYPEYRKKLSASLTQVRAIRILTGKDFDNFS